MKSHSPIFLILFSLVLAVGCVTTMSRNSDASDSGFPEDTSSQNVRSVAATQNKEPNGVITLDHALQAAMERHPSLAAAWHEIKAREGAVHQAGMFPNPTLYGEVEEFGGSGDFSGTNAMSSRVGISQEIPMGGQISRRVQVGQAQMNIAELKQAAQTLALRTDVKRRFLQVYVLQEQLKLEQDTVQLVQALTDAVAKRVAAGEASPLDEAKVAVELASSRIGVGRARRELDAARYSLASSWDGDSPKFSEVRANYPAIMEVPPENELLALIEFNPNYRILEQEVAQASAVLDLTQAEAWSNIEIGGGIQRFNETDDHAFFLEVSIPIPLFDRNQGGIQEAKQTQNRAAKELAAGLLELKTTLIETSGRLRSAQEAFFTMQNTVMPAAEEAFLAVQKAYQVGEQDYLELVEAQRTQLESQRELLELFAEVQGLRAELDALIAEKLQ